MVDDRDGGMRPTPQSPYHFRRSQAAVQGGAPHLGEHNREILQTWLGWKDEQIGAYDAVLVARDSA